MAKQKTGKKKTTKTQQAKNMASDIMNIAIQERCSKYVTEMNKVFDKYENNNKGKDTDRKKITGVIHKLLDKISISNDAMVVDLLPLSLLNSALYKAAPKDSAAFGYLVYVDGKTNKVHTLLMDGLCEKMNDLFIDGKTDVSVINKEN